jgi:hypothetical protein
MKMVMGLEGRNSSLNAKIVEYFLLIRYDILNLQNNLNDSEHSLHYVQVGTWNTGKLSLNTSSIRFFSDQRTIDQIKVRRYCSEACPVGHIKVRLFLHTSSPPL